MYFMSEYNLFIVFRQEGRLTARNQLNLCTISIYQHFPAYFSLGFNCDGIYMSDLSISCATWIAFLWSFIYLSMITRYIILIYTRHLVLSCHETISVLQIAIFVPNSILSVRIQELGYIPKRIQYGCFVCPGEANPIGDTTYKSQYRSTTTRARFGPLIG